MSGDLNSLMGSKLGPITAIPAGSQRAGARKVLEGCWSVLSKAVDPLVDSVLLEALSPMAKSDDAEEARRAKMVLAKDRLFGQGFSQALRTEFSGQLRDFISHKALERPAAKAELSLVEYGDMELATLVERSSARIRNATDEVYNGLKMRVASLVREPEVLDSDSPVRPAMFYRAAHQAMVHLGLQTEDVIELLKEFDAPLVRLAAAAYRALDDHLGGQGLSSDVAPSTGWRHTAMRGGRTSRFDAASTRGAGGGGGGAHLPNAENILQALYHRLQLVPVGTTAVMAPPGGGALMPGALVAGMPGTQPGPAAMGYLPAGAGQFPGAAPGQAMPMGGIAGGTAIMIDPNLLTAINEIQKLSALALAAAQQGAPAPDSAIDAATLRGKLADKATAQIDKLTIEIVGLLFERVNSDKHVPREVKELLQRLQFPLIKVALVDPELFVSPDQAARRLIDRIASTSVGWTSAGEENARYLREVQKAVHAVLTSAEEGLVVFEAALADFEKYLADERTRDDDPVTRAKRALAEAEGREIMAINATIRVRSAFDGVQVESYLKEFLLETWVRVLVAAALKDKGDSVNVKRFVAIVPDLVWSVQPKINPDDRKRLVGTIPPVLTALREGLLLIGWSSAQMQEFFGRLMNSHAQAVKALELAHGAAGVPFEPNTMRIKLDSIRFDSVAEVSPEARAQVRVADNVVRQVLAANQVDVDYLTLPPAVDIEPGDMTEAELDGVIMRWQRGQWFNLRIGDVTERVRLRWISPLQSLYLFTPADGRKAHSLAPDTLRAFFRSGALLPVESAPLFERAVQGVMNDLRDATEGEPAGAA